MKLGIISDLRNPQHPKFHRPWVHYYTEFLDLMVQLEDLGFEEVVFPEHHFEPDGYIPNPIPIFMPAQTPKAMERNAREGYGANQGAGRWTFEREDLGWWKHWHTEWQAALARHGRTAHECPVSAFFSLFCTHDPERAWATYRNGMLHVTHAYARLAGRPPLPETPEEVPHWDGEIPA